MTRSELIEMLATEKNISNSVAEKIVRVFLTKTPKGQF